MRVEGDGVGLQLNGGEDGACGEDAVVGAEGGVVSFDEVALCVAVGSADCGDGLLGSYVVNSESRE